MPRALKAPFGFCTVLSLSLGVTAGRLDGFWEIRHMVPGTCPHPVPQDSPGRGDQPRSVSPSLPISPSSRVSRAPRKYELDLKKNKRKQWGMLGRVSSCLGRTACPEHTVRQVPGAKNGVPAAGLAPRASPLFSHLVSFKTGIRSQRCFSSYCLWVTAGSSNTSFVPGGGWSRARQLPPLFLRGHSCHPPVVILPGGSSPQLWLLQLTRPAHC